MAVDRAQPTPSGRVRRGLKARDMAEISETFRKAIALPDLDATDRLGHGIAGGLRAGDAVALWGDLGAGKTTLARTLLRELGVTEDVPSPTFTLVQTYEAPRFAVSHYDLYRLKHPSELDELGLDEALDNGAALIEWPERAEDRLPPDALTVHLLADHERRAALMGPARWRSLESTYV